MKQSQVSGHGSTNVQVGHISASTFNHFTIFVNHAQNISADTYSETSSNVHQIANEQYYENVRLITGDYYVSLFCVTAKVIHIGQSYPKKNDKNEIDSYLSKVFFSDGVGERFIITIPTDLIPCAPDTHATVVFASNLKGDLVSCGIYDDASGSQVYLDLTSNWGVYLNLKEGTILLSSIVCFPIAFLFSVYFKIWHLLIMFNISIMQLLLIAAFTVGLFVRHVFDTRKFRIQRFVAEKHDKFLAHLDPVLKGCRG